MDDSATTRRDTPSGVALNRLDQAIDRLEWAKSWIQSGLGNHGALLQQLKSSRRWIDLAESTVTEFDLDADDFVTRTTEESWS